MFLTIYLEFFLLLFGLWRTLPVLLAYITNKMALVLLAKMTSFVDRNETKTGQSVVCQSPSHSLVSVHYGSVTNYNLN